MLEILVAFMCIVCISIYLILKKFLREINLFKLHYFAFDENFINQAYKDFKIAETKFSNSLTQIKDYGADKTVTEQQKNEVGNYIDAKFDFEQEKARYYTLISLNLSVLNGLKKVDEVRSEYSEYVDKRFDEVMKQMDKKREIMEKIKLK